MTLRDRLLGDPDRLDGPGLARGARRGSEPLAVRCVRALGERDEEEATRFLEGLLADGRAAVRRAAARGLARHGRPRSLPALLAASDPTEEGRLALAVARVRCGGPLEVEADALRAFDARALHTASGARSPAAARGLAPLEERLRLALGDGSAVEPHGDLRARRRARVEADPQGRDARAGVLALAELQAPGDYAFLAGLAATAGRRGEHAVHAALGLSGDPRALAPLREALRATDVDPGRGFAQRRLAATGLGRLGLRDAVPWVLRALQDEAHDYEGRPGAGLGIQYPVRTDLLWALGEIGDPAAVPVLLTYLGDTHGSALGGFHLPAMDALCKLGAAALPGLRDALAGSPETAAANALGTMAALGEDPSRWADDPRPAVRDVAARARGA